MVAARAVLRPETEAAMKIVVSGASGLIGTALAGTLSEQGHEVVRLVRDREAAERADAAFWSPSSGELDPAVLSGVDAVVNLNGRSIGDGRWTPAVKRELWSSRVDSTRTVVAAIRNADPPPGVLVNASATGFYGDRGDELLDESSSRGEGFLAELCAAWEQEATAAASEATREVRLRFGMVVADGGALDKMLLPFRLGLGGPIGSGRQFWPWAGLADVIGAIRLAIAEPRISGAVNVVAPEPTRCRRFTSALGKVLNRPAVLPAPAFAVRLALGEMAEALLLASARVVPRVLTDVGMPFADPRPEDAFRRALG
jgi:uncharacterized protein (TIGR01777 family)